MMNAAELKSQTVKDLAALAKRKGVRGWHSMRKEALVRALAKLMKAEAQSQAKRPRVVPPEKNGHCEPVREVKVQQANGRLNHVPQTGKRLVSHNGHGVSGDGVAGDGSVATRSSRIERRLRAIKDKFAQSHDLAYRTDSAVDGIAVKNRLVLMVRDPYWLHTYWELSRGAVERARAAMGQHWHGSRPVLRVYEVDSDSTTATARRVVRDIEIHGGVNNWYIDVVDPPRSFQADIGYLSPIGKFYSLALSNVVTTPQVGVCDVYDANWDDVAEDCDRIFALSGGNDDCTDTDELKEVFEERLRRPMGPPMAARLGLEPSPGSGLSSGFPFEVDAELVVYGSTEPDAHVTLKGEPVRVQADGSFAVRFNLPDRRQVLPIVASSASGIEQRTIVLAVERNTKVMEPVVRETGE